MQIAGEVFCACEHGLIKADKGVSIQPVTDAPRPRAKTGALVGITLRGENI